MGSDRVVAELGYPVIGGDPEVVRAYAATCSGIATLVGELLPGLDAVGRVSQDQRSEAVVELCSLAERVTSRLGKVKDRYGTMGSSLAGYAESLDAAGTQSRQAYTDAETALSSLATCTSQLRSLANASAGVVAAPAGVRVHERSGLRYDPTDTSQVTKVGLIDDAYLALDAARTAMSSAWDTLEAAAGTVVAALKALHDDGLDDGLRENASKVGNTLHLDDLRTWLADHLDDISVALGVAALLLSWVPVVGQVLAVASAVVSLAVLATCVVDLCQDGATADEWQAAGWAALGVVTLGIGRVAGKGLEIAGRTGPVTPTSGAAGSRAAGGAAGSGSKVPRVTNSTESSGSTVRELASSLDPRSTVFSTSRPFARSSYTDVQWTSNWRPVYQANWVGDKALLGQNAWAASDGGPRETRIVVEPCLMIVEAPTSPVITAPPEAVNSDFQSVVPSFDPKR